MANTIKKLICGHIKPFFMQNRYIVKFCDVNVVAKNWYLETCYVVNVIPYSPQKCIIQKLFEMCRPFINVNTLSSFFCELQSIFEINCKPTSANLEYLYSLSHID